MLTLTASGSVSDYSDSDKSGLQEKIAAIAGVDTSFVTIHVAAGSVRITATIVVPASKAPDAVRTSLSSALGTTFGASTTLGLMVEAVPTITIALAEPPLLAAIAGYVPGSDVTQHNKIDLDQKEMETALKASPADFGLAKTWYTVGGNSMSKGSFRTLQGFSTKAQWKMYDGCPGCPYKHYKQFYDYYGSFTYADDWALAALDGTTLTFGAPFFEAPGSLSFNFGDAADAARKEVVKKGTVNMHAWMYAIREFEDAIDDCQTCTANCDEFSANDAGPVHAWDEGVAFYTGSLEGEAPGGSWAGKLVYRNAEKRCASAPSPSPSPSPSP